jgi:N-acetylmuramoyl-L-alanine amidase
MRRRRATLFSLAVLLLLALLGTLALASRGQDSPPGAGSSPSALDEAVTVSGGTRTQPADTVNTQTAPAVPAPAPAPPPPAAGSLAGRVIVIDPGHASNTDMGTEPTGPGSQEYKVKDPGGTSGVVSGVREPVVNLAVSLYLKGMLEAEGAKVIMTREGDVYSGGNRERAEVANQAGADLFVRIHCDGSNDPSSQGVSTLYPASIPGWTDDIYAPSKQAAVAVESSLATNLGAVDNGAVERSDMTGFNWADVPAILTEVGFMTNAEEDQRLNSPEYQQQVAGALLLGIKGYFSGG